MSIQHMQMVFDAGDLTAPQKAVLLAYCNFTDAHGYCWPGVERIADMTGLSASGVKKVRKQLTEAGLLKTVSRGKKGGGRTTNASRINIKRIQSMKRPERTYDDNVMDGLGFEEDANDVPDSKGNGAPQEPNGSPEAQQKYPGGTNDGAPGAPYPSVDPSCDPSSSSAEVEDITSVAVTTATTKRKNESPEEIVIERTGCTPEEAVAVVDLIETQGDDGKPIRRIVPWVRGRTDRDLQRDLAQVRRHSAAPTVTECGIHACEMKPYGCDACAGEIKAGDPEDITRLRSHLAAVGEKARPDLARLLGAPQRPAGAPFDRDPTAYLRGINKAHQDPRYAPGTGSYVDPDTVYTDDPKVVFGTSRPKRPQDLSGALAPVVTAEQIRNGTDDFRL